MGQARCCQFERDLVNMAIAVRTPAVFRINVFKLATARWAW